MKFRPTDDPRNLHEGDPHPDGPTEWVDNPVSNAFAWASYRFIPGWCQTPEHWTSRFTQTLFTDCPCCLLFRGIVVGLLLGTAAATLVYLPVIVAMAYE